MARTQLIPIPSDDTALVGDIFYRDANGNLKALPAGTTGKFLQSNGANAAPSYETAPTSTEVLGVAAGYKVARGVHSQAAAIDTVDTGLATVVAIVVTSATNPSVNIVLYTASIGDQSSAPVAGSVYIKAWKNTTAGAAGNPDLVAASVFTGSPTVNWIAIGT